MKPLCIKIFDFFRFIEHAVCDFTGIYVSLFSLCPFGNEISYLISVLYALRNYSDHTHTMNFTLLYVLESCS